MAQAQKVTRADIEAKVAEIEQRLQGSAERAKPPIFATGIVMTVIVILVAYLFGKRIGAKKTTIVEVKRV